MHEIGTPAKDFRMPYLVRMRQAGGGIRGEAEKATLVFESSHTARVLVDTTEHTDIRVHHHTSTVLS